MLLGIFGTALIACCLIGGNVALDYSDIPDYNETVKFYLHTRTNIHEPQQLFISGGRRLEETNFDVNKKTVVVIHGYNGNAKDEMEVNMKEAALANYDVNVINVDWSTYADSSPDYGYAFSHVRFVGIFLGKFLEQLIAQGVKEADLHLVGHSLGAHVAGYAGKKLKTDGHLLGRISGLDAAFPGFYDTLFDPTRRLDARDAEFVDCIHTCGGKLGFPNPFCQADFFPNGGLDVQPGCSILDLGECSHKRSYAYFAESFNSSHHFNAKSCSGVLIWAPFNCHDKGAVMGYPATPKFKGALTVTTNSRYPFARSVTA